jgi:hypothetical protein
MTTQGKYVSEEELNARAVAPRVTLEALEANIVSEVYFTAHQGARASLLDTAVDADEQPDAEKLADGLRHLHPSLRLLTICVLVLNNGFTVIGQSACASAENYQEDIGRRVARGDAIRQVWALMGYELRSKLNDLAELRAVDSRLGDALTRLTAHGLGNHEILRSSDVDVIYAHFMNQLGDLARDSIKQGVEREALPVAPPLGEAPEPEGDWNMTAQEVEPVHFSGYAEEGERSAVETNELGPKDVEAQDQPVVGSDAPEVKEA